MIHLLKNIGTIHKAKSAYSMVRTLMISIKKITIDKQRDIQEPIRIVHLIPWSFSSRKLGK